MDDKADNKQFTANRDSTTAPDANANAAAPMQRSRTPPPANIQAIIENARRRARWERQHPDACDDLYRGGFKNGRHRGPER